jgi:putative flippase GtrA
MYKNKKVMHTRFCTFVNKKIKVKLLLLLFIVPFVNIPAKNNLSNQLSQEATISLLTCAPGEELYSVFGHTAIRVSDPENEIDLVFNYGTFDFNTPFFYLKFGHGNLDYLLSVSPFKRFMREYFMTNRSVWEQELSLSESQKESLFRDLIVNAQPQNRAYQYDFFYDNCATRVADIVLEQYSSDRVNFSTENIPVSLTFREAIHPYLEKQPWTKFGIDLILGAPADAQTDSASIMFLPDYLMGQFSGIRIDDTENLVAATNILLDLSDYSEYKAADWWSPTTTLWVLFILIALWSFTEQKGKGKLKVFDFILFSAVSLLGIVIFYLSWISNHQVTSPNWNLLWANPFWILLVTNVKYIYRKLFCFLQGVALVIFLVVMAAGIQYFPYESLPVILLLIVRGFFSCHLQLK